MGLASPVPVVGRRPQAGASRQGKMPPLNPRPDELVLLRDPNANFVTLVLDSGDSYLVKSDNLTWYLERLGCEGAAHLVDYVWSFGAVWVGTLLWQYHRVSLDDAKRTFLRR